MDPRTPPAHDAELVALRRDLEDIRQRMDAWMAAATQLLADRSDQMSNVVERLEELAREVRLGVREVTLPDVPTANAEPRADAATGGLDELWTTMQPVALGRLRVLEQARDAARSGSLDDPQREAAITAARQLMGSLGGYGRLEGSAAADRAATLLAAQHVRLEALDEAVRDLAASVDPGSDRVHARSAT